VARLGGDLLLLSRRIEALLLGDQRPGEVEQLAGGGAPGDLHRLPGGAQAIVKRLDGGIMACRAQGRHVQGSAEAGVAAVTDARPSADAPPRLAGHRGQSDVGRGGRRSIAEGPRERCDQQPSGGDEADPRGAEQAHERFGPRPRLERGSDLGLEVPDTRVKIGDQRVEMCPDRRDDDRPLQEGVTLVARLAGAC